MESTTTDTTPAKYFTQEEVMKLSQEHPEILYVYEGNGKWKQVNLGPETVADLERAFSRLSANLKPEDNGVHWQKYRHLHPDCTPSTLTFGIDSTCRYGHFQDRKGCSDQPAKYVFCNQNCNIQLCQYHLDQSKIIFPSENGWTNIIIDLSTQTKYSNGIYSVTTWLYNPGQRKAWEGHT
jgi:hypothetical protein